MAKKTSAAPSARTGTVTDEMKSWAFVGMILPIIGYVIILLTKKGGPYAEYYGKQGLVLGITGIIIKIIGWILMWVVFIGWTITMILCLAWVILWIVGIVYAFSGERKALPVIGDFATRF